MIQRTLVFNPLSENCYFLTDDETGKTFIIDPGCSTYPEFLKLKRMVTENGMHPERILLTHTHFDHAMGATQVEGAYGIKTFAHPADENLLAKIGHYLSFFGFEQPFPAPSLGGYLSDGERLELGKSILEVIHVPGHTQGGVSFYLKEEKMLFSGDTLFQGSVGRTDLGEGDAERLQKSLTRLMQLPDDTVVFPGHGAPTTIGEERAHNAYIIYR